MTWIYDGFNIMGSQPGNNNFYFWYYCYSSSFESQSRHNQVGWADSLPRLIFRAMQATIISFIAYFWMKTLCYLQNFFWIKVVNALICEGFIVQALHLFGPVLVFTHDVLVQLEIEEMRRFSFSFMNWKVLRVDNSRNCYVSQTISWT